MQRSKTERPVNVCGDCEHGTEVQEHWNRALDGHYICVRCPYSERCRLKSEPAGSEHFKKQANL